MKKILICILLVIPILISLAITTSGRLIATRLGTPVTKIELLHLGKEVPGKNDQVDVCDYIGAEKIHDYYLLTATTYPLSVDATLSWRTSFPEIATISANEDGRAEVYFSGTAFGEVTISCYVSDELYDYVTIFVTSRNIVDVDIVPYGETEPQTEYAMKVGESTVLNKDVLPSTAQRSKTFVWQSDNENVLSVTAGGIVTAKSVGTANVTVSIVENKVSISSSIAITVSASDSILTKDKLTIAANEVDLSAYADGATYVVTEGNATIVGNTLVNSGGAGTVVLNATRGSATEVLQVEFTAGRNRLAINGYDTLMETKWADEIYANLDVYEYYLNAIVENDDYTNSVPAVTISSSNTNVVVIEGALMKPVGAGEATITVSADGFDSFDFVVTVKQPVANIALKLDNETENGGLEGKLVFGNLFSKGMDLMQNYSYVNTYQLEVQSVAPIGAAYDFVYTSSNERFATVDNKGLIKFYEAAIDNEVTIYAYAKYTFGGAVFDSYTFSIVKGINIGLDVVNNTEQDPNFDVYFEVRNYLHFAEDHMPVVLHTDVYYPPQDEDGTKIYLNDSLYGNNHKLDGMFYTNSVSTMMLEIHHSDEEILNDWPERHIKLRNVMLSPGQVPKSDTDWETLRTAGGYALRVDLGTRWREFGYSLDVSFCTIRYCYSSVLACNGDITFDGCLFYNTAAAGIILESYQGNGFTYAPDVTVNNCIFANSLVPSIMLYPHIMQSETDIITPSTLNLTGTNYFYNWKRIKDISLDLLTSDSLGNAELADSINRLINSEFKSMVKQPEFAQYTFKDESPDAVAQEDDYINLCVFALGVWYNAAAHDLNYDQSQLNEVWVDISSSFISYVGDEQLLMLSMRTADDGSLITSPNVKYSEARDENGPLYIRRLRGEA